MATFCAPQTLLRISHRLRCSFDDPPCVLIEEKPILNQPARRGLDCGVVSVEWIDGDGRPRQDAVVGADTTEGPAAEGWRLDLNDFEADHLRQGVGRYRHDPTERPRAERNAEPDEA